MNSKLHVVIGVLSLVLVIVGASFLYQLLSVNYAASSSASPPADNETQASDADDRIPASDFTVTDIDGKEFMLSDFFGKPIVLNFWASWCPPCKRELPDFEKVYTELGNEVTFLMVDLADGQSETVAIASAYIKENGYSFPVYYDTAQDAANAYGISAIPTTFFIDSDGFVVTGQKGAMDEDTLRRGIALIYSKDGATEAESGENLIN